MRRARRLRRGRGMPVYGVLLAGLAGCHGTGSAVGHDAGAPSADAAETYDLVGVPVDSAKADTWMVVDSGLVSGHACDASSQCISGACTLGTCSDWPGAMQIAIDTTPRGAGILEDADNFPLLVRLTAENFPFDKARDDGGDIRFMDRTGRDLPFEIERWDSRVPAAAVWVLVPHVAGKSADNVITMYWGNPLSVPRSSGPAVFGGFAMVLHLSPSSDLSADQTADASGQGNAGKLMGESRLADWTDALAGQAIDLDGEDDFIGTGNNMAAPQTFTLSLWFKTSSKSRGGLAGFASLKESDAVSHDREIAINEAGQIEFLVVHGSVSSILRSMQSYNDGLWHYVTARLSKTGQYLFVDGEAVNDDPTIGGADTYNGFWRFGEVPQGKPPSGTPAGNHFVGLIDEIRISSEALNDAWIKLSYATQRPNTGAVSYLR
jgi:hypothetical protein